MGNNAEATRHLVNPNRLATIALDSVLTCQRNGWPLSQETIDEVRLAHSLLTVGSATQNELRSILGANWEITRRPDHPNAISYKQYFEAQITALAGRLEIAPSFIKARLNRCNRDDFDKIMRGEPR